MVSRNVMVMWLRNLSAAKIFVINEISVSLQKKNALIEWVFLPKIAQNAYHTKEFVLVMNHYFHGMDSALPYFQARPA